MAIVSGPKNRFESATTDIRSKSELRANLCRSDSGVLKGEAGTGVGSEDSAVREVKRYTGLVMHMCLSCVCWLAGVEASPHQSLGAEKMQAGR